MARKSDYGRLTERRPLTTNKQPASGFPGSRTAGSKPTIKGNRNPKQKDSGPMKSAPFPPNVDKY